MGKKVVITDYEYENVETEKNMLEAAGFEVVACHCSSEEELVRAVSEADGVIVQYCRITSDVIERMKNCRIIVKYGIGVDNIDVKAAIGKGIYVCNIPDYGVEEVANHVMTYLLMMAKKMPAENEDLKLGNWGYQAVVPLKRLSSCTLGLLGFGRIPRAVCKRALSFGLKVIACDPYAKGDQIVSEGAEKVSFEELLAESDFISCHCPLTENTRYCIDDKAIERMKQGAYIINTSRGGIIKESDLIQALNQGKIAGAALDVFEQEPLPKDSTLRKMSSVLLSGHCAWYSEGALSALHNKAAEEVIRVLNGGKPLNPVTI